MKDHIVHIGLAGLGRLGQMHARNISSRIKKVKLSALCDANEDLLNHFSKELNVPDSYTSFSEMLLNPKLDAIAIVTPSALHCEQIGLALDAGFHVFCEKPLGVDLKDSLRAEQAVINHPDKVFMLGFMRRFDPSYQYAKNRLDSGELGKPILFRSYSVDPVKSIDSVLSYIPHSAGQFVDMAVHDIDLARWFLNSEPKSIYAIGGCFSYPQFGEFDDGDNVSALMQFENDAMAFFLAGRTAPHGYNVETEIIGTKSTLRIGSVPQKNLVEIIDNDGIRKECSQSFHERFDEAFTNEIQEFVDCILEGRTPDVSVNDGVQSSKIAELATKSFKTNSLIKL